MNVMRVLPLRIKRLLVLRWLNLVVKLVRFVLFTLAAFLIYEALLTTILTREAHVVTYILFWIFTAYVFLPRLNRRISGLYLPNYFIGRARTGDGLLGDPINLAVRGTKEDIVRTFEAAGWVQADPITLRSTLAIIRASLFGRSYPSAPVSPLYLFEAPQSLAFQREVNNNPRRRHHVRFWKTPAGWYLPGGMTADWLGAATYDKSVGLSLFTGQVTHKIDGNVDIERDFVIGTIRSDVAVKDVEVLKHFTSSYHGRNGGGDMIRTDGSLPLITIAIAKPEAATAPGRPRRTTTKTKPQSQAATAAVS